MDLLKLLLHILGFLEIGVYHQEFSSKNLFSKKKHLFSKLIIHFFIWILIYFFKNLYVFLS